MTALQRWTATWFLLVAAAVAPARAEEMAYVIKVTPSLVYLDVGAQLGVAVGDEFAILRPEGTTCVQVAQVSVVRVAEAYSIAEITFRTEGETLQMLQRALPLLDWEAQAQPAAAHKPPRRVGRCMAMVIGGGEWLREADLVWHHSGLMMPPQRGHGVAVGARLGSVVSDRWRLNLTCRVGVGGDVTAMGIEGDLHYLPYGYAAVGPYLGIGGGLQALTWDAPPQQDDSAMKYGGNVVIGVQVPGPWTVLAEAGYQRVMRWDDLVDVSNVRTFVGVGRSF